MNPDEAQLVSQIVDPNGNIEEQILRIACYDEYKANAYYQKVLDTFGSVRPFSNIVEAEVRHYRAQEQLCQKYGVTPPINDWYEKIVVGTSLAECCQDGVDAEIANIEMYDNLLRFVAFDDIRDVFFKEQAASYNSHLPAFTQCLESYQSQESIKQNPNQHHDIYNMVQGLMKGDMDTAKLTQTLSSLASRDLILGMAAGAALTMALTSSGSKDIFANIFNSDEDTNENSETKDKS